MSEAITMEKNEQGTWEIKLPESADPAKLEQAGMLEGIGKTEIMGVPIGGAAIGVAISSLLDALVARFAPGQAGFMSGTMGKLLLAYVTKSYLSRWLGTRTADAAAFVFTIDAISGWVEKLIGGVIGGIGLQQARMTQGSVLHQAQRVVQDYYGQAESRR